MGLDMYLKAEKYVGGWNHGKDAEFDGLVKLMGIKPTDSSPSITVGVTVAYWRKANAIHKWFVDNVQDGVDECQSSYVSREQLEELRDLCKKVLDHVETVPGKLDAGTTYHGNGDVEHHTVDGQVVAQQQLAEDLLPTQEGFFFGGTDYDEYYLEDCKATIEMLDEVLNNTALKDCDFHYQSSW